MKIMTASWFARLPPGHRLVGVSRGVPRRFPPGYRRYRQLEPGAWFRSVTPAEYLQAYNSILAKLDPQRVANDLCDIAGDGIMPVMACFENASQIQAGAVWCHRHIVATWLEDRLGITVEEVDHPSLDRFARLRLAGIEPPSYITSER